MAAPANTTRSAPAGIRLEDGYRSLIAFALDPDASFWEVEVGAPPIEGGPPVDITTMHNNDWVTKVPQDLKDLEEFTVTAMLDPVFLSTGGANNLVNKNGAITRQFPDGTDWDFFGYVRRIEVQPSVRGQPQMVNLTIVPTNWDNVNRVEAGPVLTSVSGS